MIGKFEGVHYANPKESHRFLYRGYRWTVFDVDDLRPEKPKDDEHGYLGLTIAYGTDQGGVILLERKQPLESRARVLVHELCHMFDITTLGCTLDEPGVCAMEDFIHQFGPEIARSLVAEEAREQVLATRILKTRKPTPKKSKSKTKRKTK